MIKTRFCFIFLMVSAKWWAPPSARSAEVALKNIWSEKIIELSISINACQHNVA